ncbi:hypothetical protein [Pandoraea fibrosis]|uniref:Uncharacterized protein n=1 Tax=Pandoraea fibrosis TaxID=1891094 RepID=A0A5E4SY93_9BURK|nr:hypothetical protein [Pandoraea fibrosis]VVD80790.1 hypothetical protein PFI31113_01100 [Pandoraea fibrosis]
MPALTPYSMGLSPFVPAPGAVEASLPALCHTPLADDFAGARIQYAHCEPRQASTAPAAPCHPFLPSQSPVEVQMLGGTFMHLHTEADRVAFLNKNRPGAYWVELLDAVRPVNDCPKTTDAAALQSEMAERMACLGLAKPARRASEANDPQTSPSPEATTDSGQAHHRSGEDNTSEFHTAESLMLPSTYLPQETYAPGTMAALEYDLGWRALAPSWRALMPEVDEASWRTNPNPELFCAVGRAVLPHLTTDADGALMDDATLRIVSFHLHAGGLTDCLADFTRVAERTDSEGRSRTVAAIEVTDFVRDCAGPKWREALVAAQGADGLSRRREACDALGREVLSTSTPRAAGDDDISEESVKAPLL